MADGGAKVGSEGLFVEYDERKDDRRDRRSEGGDTVNRSIAAASFLTGLMGGLPRFLIAGDGAGHGDEGGLGSGVVVEDVELLSGWPLKPMNWAALLKKVFGLAPVGIGSSPGDKAAAGRRTLAKGIGEGGGDGAGDC